MMQNDGLYVCKVLFDVVRLHGDAVNPNTHRIEVDRCTVRELNLMENQSINI